MRQISPRQRAHRPDQNPGWCTARRQGETGEGMARGYWPDGLLFWGGPLRWITWQFCELADGTATCAQHEMRYRQSTGLKYAAHPLRDGTVSQEVVFLMVGYGRGQPQQKYNEFWLGLTRVQKSHKPQFSSITALPLKQDASYICHLGFSNSHILKNRNMGHLGGSVN